MRSAECAVLGNFTDEVTLLGVAGQITLGILDLDLPCDIRDIIADVKNLAETDRVRWNLIGMLAFDLIGLIPVIGALKYSDETAESIASGEKILKESGTIYESFADMMSPDDAAKYLDFLENGSREGLTSAELAGVEKADALLVSRKVEYEDVWDLRNAGDVLESGSKGGLDTIIKNGKVSIDDIKTNPSAFSGKSAEEIADVLRNSGYDVTIKNSTRSRSGAQIIQINNSGGGKNISQVQVSPGGGRHGSNPYVKISTTDQGIIKIVDGIEGTYKTDGKETATIIFSGGN